jgi:hypothetical protein
MAMSMGEKDPIAVGRIIRELIDEPGGLDLHLGRGLHSSTFQLNLSRFNHTSLFPPV